MTAQIGASNHSDIPTECPVIHCRLRLKHPVFVLSLGISRDDAGMFLPAYVERGVLEGDPFVSVDQTGVGFLMKHAIREGRGRRKDLKCGICGEHGGDPASVIFCNEIGLDYVSCSPYRVPVARLAAAHATLKAS